MSALYRLEKKGKSAVHCRSCDESDGKRRWALVYLDGMEIKDMRGTRGIYNNLIKAFSFQHNLLIIYIFFL